MLTLQQFLLKRNLRVKHHDRLFYGLYAYSQRIVLPINDMLTYKYYTFTEHRDLSVMNDWYRTNQEIRDLRATIKELDHDIRLRREGKMLHLYANDLELLDRYIDSVDGIYDDEIIIAELSCSPPNAEKNVHVRKTLPYGRFRNEVLLRTWRFGVKAVAQDEAVRKFYKTYKGQVWNRELEADEGVCRWYYTSLWLEDESLVPVVYLVFGQAVQKVITYKLESEMES